MKKAIPALLVTLALAATPFAAAAGDAITCYFPPNWDHRGDQAKAITDALAKESGVAVAPKVAKSYPEILTAFEAKEPCLVYVGSFTQAIIQAKGLGAPMLQVKDGKENYGAWMIYPKGEDPQAILKDHPAEVAFAMAASSGESGAKAATHGKAALGMASHDAAADAVVAGKAKAAFVKNWWWEEHKGEYPQLEVVQIPGVSDAKNPDNVLTGSKALPPQTRERLLKAALASKEVFGGKETVRFTAKDLEFTLSLMKQAGISPVSYKWGN